MKDKLLTLIVLIGAIVILGCVSNNTNTAQNNTSVNTTSSSSIVSDKLQIDGSNYNDSAGLTAVEKLAAIKVALSAGPIQSDLQESVGIDVGDVLPTNASGKPVWIDSGFLNTSDNFVSVPINTSGNIGSGIAYFGVFFVVYVDISKGKVVGTDVFDLRGGNYYTVTDFPENSYWYHQLVGTTRIGQEYNTTRMNLAVITSSNDTDAIYPLILDKENFEKYRNGSRYEALQYMDYMTDQTKLIDGKAPLSSQNVFNGSVVWVANISASYWSPSYEIYMDRPANYYIVLQNKANRTIPISLHMYSTFFQ